MIEGEFDGIFDGNLLVGRPEGKAVVKIVGVFIGNKVDGFKVGTDVDKIVGFMIG